MTPLPVDSTAQRARPICYEQFGVNFIRQILGPERVTASIDQVLGEQMTLGPIKAGPGRRFATVKARAHFHPSTARELFEAQSLTYRVQIPITVDFFLDLPAMDCHEFRADVVVPILLVVTTEDPLTIVWTITPPREDELTIRVATDRRRSAWLQKVSGLDYDLRGFLARVVANELSKPHVRRATRIDMFELINRTWPQIAANFLPTSPADREVPPGWTFAEAP